MDELVEMLRAQPLLEGIPTEVIRQAIAPHVVRQSVRADETIYAQGAAPSYLYMVADGELEALLADEAGIRRYNLVYPGEFFGDTALLAMAPAAEEMQRGGPSQDRQAPSRPAPTQPVTMRTITPCTLLLMHGSVFLDLYDSDPSVRRQVALMEQEIEKRAQLSKTFEGRAPDEVVIEVKRRHWMALVRQTFPGMMAWMIIWFSLGAIVAYVLRGASPETQFNVSLGMAALWFIPVLYLLWEMVDWWNDYFIITDRRVIHVERVALLMNERYEVPMNKIQNVNLAQMNPVDKFFGYGKISISTAVVGRGMSTIIMDFIPEAERLAERIVTEQNRAQYASARMEREDKRAQVRRALGMENEPGEPAPPREPPPAPPRPQEGALRRLLSYLRPTTREDDGYTITWRRHWFSILKRSLPAYGILIGLLIALTFFAFSGRLNPGDDRRLLILFTVLIAVDLLVILWLYDDWRNDRYILTHDAIVDIESLPLGFRKDVRRAQLDMIQDIKYLQRNPFMVAFDIGDVIIQTAGAQGDFTFDFVPKPRDVQAEIAQALQRHRAQQSQKQVGQLREELIELIEVYDEVRRTEERNQGRDRRANEYWERLPSEATTRGRPSSEAPTRRARPRALPPSEPPPSVPTDPTL